MNINQMLKMYSIFDRVAEEGSPPFVARTDGVAIRHFMHNLSKNPNIDDYSLHCVAYYDPETMKIQVHQDQPRTVVFTSNPAVEVVEV